MTPYQTELEVGKKAVRAAAAICRRVQATITPDTLEKKDKSPVTIADFASQAVTCRALQAAFPDDLVIGEEGAEELRSPEQAEFLRRITALISESGIDVTGPEVCDWIDRGGLQDQRPRFWTLDPIDGTKGFLRKEHYAVSLALIVDGDIRVGLLGCPRMRMIEEDDSSPEGVLAWAVEGQGAWMQPLDDPQATPRRISVTRTSDPTDARFCESVESGHSAHDWAGMIAAELGIHRAPYRIDSQCKYLAVARGDADLYLRLPTRPGYQEKIWDHAGGVILVREAGGRVTDIHGLPVEFLHGAKLKNNEGMIVTNQQFHEQVVHAVGKNRP